MSVVRGDRVPVVHALAGQVAVITRSGPGDWRRHCKGVVESGRDRGAVRAQS